MPLLITELMLGDINTISIPTDAIIIISLLIVFALLGYLFNHTLNDQTSQLTPKIDVDSNLELAKEILEDQLKIEATNLDKESAEKPRTRSLNFSSPSKFLGLGSLVFVAIGGANLLDIQNMQKSYEGLKSSRANIKLESQSTKSSLSMVDLQTLEKNQTNIKKINYITPSFSSINNSKNNYYYKSKEKNIENNFSF